MEDVLIYRSDSNTNQNESFVWTWGLMDVLVFIYVFIV